MALKSTWCPVLQGYVTQVTDPAGCVAAVFCAEFERSSRTCRMKREAYQYRTFSALTTATAVDALNDRRAHCTMW
jgi:hypothetical protein